MPKIFISYRRRNTSGITGRIADRLQAHFGKESVFMDVDTIPLGVDFRHYLSNTINQCDVFLAVIDNKWLGEEDSGRRKLEDPADFVRIELETALKRDIPVIPLLVDRAPMPKAEQLPSAVADLAFRNAADVDSGRDFHSHINRLIAAIERLREFNAPAVHGAGLDNNESSSPGERLDESPGSTLGCSRQTESLSNAQLYFLWFWPRSILGWIARLLFYPTFGTAIILIVLILGDFDRSGDALALLFLSLLAAVFTYGLSNNDGQ